MFCSIKSKEDPRTVRAVPQHHQLGVIMENETKVQEKITDETSTRYGDGSLIDDDISITSTGCIGLPMPRTQSTSALRRMKKHQQAFTFIDKFQDSHRHSDDTIVTPFAQIMHSLRSVRRNLISLTKSSVPLKSNKKGCLGCEKIPSEEFLSGVEYEKISSETLEELEWCLEQLEIIQTHRSVSEMATNKFKRILNRELSHFAESSKAGNQISEYISSTFLDKQEDIYRDEPFTPSTDSNKYVLRANDLHQREIEKPHRKSPMLEITGVKRPSITPPTSSLNLPKYGVEPNDPQQLDAIMSELDKWGMDVFEVASLTNNRPLTVITYTILVKRNILKSFGIPEVTMLNYLMTAEDHYRPSIPYHNSLHAADVTQSAHSLLGQPALEKLFSDLELLATIFACSIHDIDHPGLTNNYFITTGSDLALMYNDESVLENHHLAVGFKLLQQKDCDFLASLPTKSRQLLRRIVISIVLATDMNKHMDHVAHLKTMVEARKLSGTDILNQEHHSDRLLILQHLVHCADLSNPTKPLNLYRKWTDRIMEEFFRQGDSERSQNLDISPMCDRHTATIEKSQVGFIDYIVHPLWESWAELVEPGCKDTLDNLESNRDWYYNAATTSVTPTPTITTNSAEEKCPKDSKTQTPTGGLTGRKKDKDDDAERPICVFILGDNDRAEENLISDKEIDEQSIHEIKILPSILLDSSRVE